MRKQVLFVSPVSPVRDGIGIQQRAFRNLNLLTDHYAVDAVILADKFDDRFLKQLPVNATTCIDFAYKDLPDRLRTVPGMQLLWRIWWHVGQRLRITLRKSKIKKRLSEVLACDFEFVFYFRIKSYWVHSFLASNNANFSPRTIVDFDDYESLARSQMLPYIYKAMGRQKYYSNHVDIFFTKRLENKILRSADHVLVSSEIDKISLTKKGSKLVPITVLPNTVYLPDKLPRSQGSRRIMFLGAMNYYPNIDGAVFFCSTVLPILREKLPNPVEIYLVGSSPSDEILQLGRIAEVTVTGRVENLRDYYQKSDIVIVPIRMGGGTRIKIIEAMAYGRMVMSTTIGCEGIPIRSSQELVIADEPEKFAIDCASYLSCPNSRHVIEQKARKFVEEKYSYESAQSIFQSSHV